VKLPARVRFPAFCLFTTMEMEYSNKGKNNMNKKIKQMEK
jgi:hypothetical protein